MAVSNGAHEQREAVYEDHALDNMVQAPGETRWTLETNVKKECVQKSFVMPLWLRSDCCILLLQSRLDTIFYT